MAYDRALGMFCGLIIGDTLGAAHEYDNNVYTGLVQPYKIRLRYVTRQMSTQPTDDSEMSLALLRTLDKYGSKKEKIIQAYLNWANGKSLEPLEGEPNYIVTSLGKNTRLMLKGVTTLSGYYKRYEKHANPEIQSNGTLMRASPYALLENGAELSAIDATITNPSRVNQECNYVYVSILRLLILGREGEIPNKLKDLLLVIQEDVVKSTIVLALNGDVTEFKRRNNIDSFGGKKKGWVIIPLFLSIRALFTFNNIMDMYSKVILDPEWGGPRSDSDTNCAIISAMLSARFGFNYLMTDERMKYNWDKVTKWYLPERLVEFPTDQPKHLDYTTKGVETIIQRVLKY